jgi:hypothetical protein
MEAGSTVKRLALLALASALLAQKHAPDPRVGEKPDNACQRPRVGSAIAEPEDLRSRDGVLKVDLTIQNSTEGQRLDPLLLRGRKW